VLARGAVAEQRSFVSDLADSWREVRSRSCVWSVILSFAAYHAFVLPALFVFGPLIAEQARGGAAAWGIICTGFGIGGVLGSALTLRWRPQRPGIVIGAALCVSSTQAAIVVSTLPTLVVAALELVTGATTAVCFTVWETALQQRIEGTAQARVSSFDYLGSLALMPFGFLAMNPLGEALGIRPAALAATTATLLISLLVASGRDVRGLRREHWRAADGPRFGSLPG